VTVSNITRDNNAFVRPRYTSEYFYSGGNCDGSGGGNCDGSDKHLLPEQGVMVSRTMR
jgi:hypothetical protein